LAVSLHLDWTADEEAWWLEFIGTEEGLAIARMLGELMAREWQVGL
jgi:hypothetical protein